MMWLRSARGYRSAAPQTSRRAAGPGASASGPPSSAVAQLTGVLIAALTDVAGALPPPDEPRAHAPAGAAFDGVKADGGMEERLQLFLAEDR